VEPMFQVRFHGRGGQGLVTAAELLSVAAFLDGRHAQAFPSFGSERMGAPVVAFCRISDSAIRTRAPVDAPDAVLVGDVTLVTRVDVLAGLSADGYLLINSSRAIDEVALDSIPTHALTVPATDLARSHLGRPLPSAALLGGLAALTGQVSLAAVAAALRQRFSGRLAEGNVAAAAAGFETVTAQRREVGADARPA
jgi:pyruvate ferredoxin oxidoreductase gamma subunit